MLACEISPVFVFWGDFCDVEDVAPDPSRATAEARRAEQGSGAAAGRAAHRSVLMHAVRSGLGQHGQWWVFVSALSFSSVGTNDVYSPGKGLVLPEDFGGGWSQTAANLCFTIMGRTASPTSTTCLPVRIC